MSRKHAGRHRAPGFSPISELADIAAQGAQPAMKVSAIAVASGGLIATFALPAAASPGDSGNAVFASAVQGQGIQGLAKPALAVASVSAVSVAAPAKPTNAPSFGVLGFQGSATPAAADPVMKIAKVAPPAPVVTVSRSTTRTTPTRTATAAARAPSAPAPVVNLPAPTGGIIGIAASLSGIPYVYGGTSTGGFDCSGFTGYVYRLAGKSIPRTAEAQRSASVKVANPVPGDLIFFGFPAYHVGIYAGPGMMYDAQHPGTVTGLHSIWTYNSVSYGRF
ncbi:MAG: C40 family peptidase [Lapillicoccus sp.]